MDRKTVETVFQTLKGGTFVGVDTVTVPRLKGGRKNEQQGRVRKHMTGATVMCFSNQNGSAYNAMVQRRLAQEGKNPNDFVLSPRTWGQRITGTPFVEHKDKLYLEVIFIRPGTVHYTLDGVTIPKSQVEGLAESGESEQGGLEDKVVLRTFDLASVVALRANGQEWT